MIRELWWQAHRPKDLSTYIFQNDDHQARFEQYIEDKSIPNLLLHGIRGSGKTTLAHILINSIVPEDYRNTNVLYLNGSTEGNIDTMRNKIRNHISKIPFGHGSMNIVFIDEADGLSNAAQAALRSLMEEHDSTSRFIFTCNYINKLTHELRSRFTEYKFTKLNKESLLEACVGILVAEGVELDDDSTEVLMSLVDMYSTDFRKLINALESSTIDGKLTAGVLTDNALEINLELLELLNKGDWIRARELVAESLPEDEFIEIYRFLYHYLHEIDKFKDDSRWKKGMIIISDYMYRHALHPDAEINLTGCMIRLGEL